MNRMWVDPPSGYLYGFPKVYDSEHDGDVSEWIYRQGYPDGLEIAYVRMWEATDQDRDEYDDRTDD